MTIGEWLTKTEAKFNRAGIKSARLDTLIILENFLKRDRTILLANPNLLLNSNIPRNIRILEEMVNRRIKREPLAYILGFKEFYGLKIKVTPSVLIPRPETESMVETAVISAPRNSQVLELGTGSACIAISLKKNRPDLTITATDISDEALNIARQNAKTYHVDIKFTKSDLFSAFQIFKGSTPPFDLILANLPYVPSGTRHEAELNYEPVQALYAGVDGLKYYRIFLELLPNYLKPDGFALIEAGLAQFVTIKQIATTNNYISSYITDYIIKLTPKSQHPSPQKNN